MSGEVRSPVEEALENQPFGALQLRVVLLCALVQAFDGFDLGTIGMAAPSLSKAWGVAPPLFTTAFVMSSVGILVGALLSGPLGDRFGRKPLLIISVAFIGLFSVLSAFTWSIPSITAMRFLTGLGLGGMVPIDQALVTEYAPASIRGRVAAILPLCWPMGYFCAAGAALLLVPQIGWRWLFALGVLPAILAFIIRRRVPESPRWLASQGRHEEARESLAYVGVDDKVLEQARRELAAAPPRTAVPEATFRDLFTPPYARRVIHTWLLWFCSNFSANAFSVWLPTIYSQYYHIELSRTLFYTFIVAGTQVVGRICAFTLIDILGRKTMIVLGYGIAGCAALAFTQSTTETSLLVNAMVYAFFQDIGSLAMTVYTPEVYPVRIRGKGTAIAMGWGRFGGMASPLVAGMLIGAGNLILVWGMIGAMQFLAAGLTLLLAYETRGNLESVSTRVA